MATTNNQQIDKLRAKIKEDPKRFKSMSRLSHLLINSSKNVLLDEDEREHMKKEAFELAQRCVDTSPPATSIGYAALSISSPTFKERMDALRKVIELEEARKSLDAISSVGLAFAVLRLLIEPREEEKNNKPSMITIGGSIPKNSLKNPSKRDLDLEERNLYKKIKE